MAEPSLTPGAEAQAADWITRLNRSVVDQDDLAAFRVWRQQPGNEAAFQALRQTWRGLAELSSDPDVVRELDRLGSRKRRLWPALARAAWPAAGLASVLAVVGIGIGLNVQSSKTLRYATAVGERSVVRLADGSTVHLDTDSALSVRFSGGQRALRLDRGQALFDVAHDVRRPFVVRSGALAVTATGTRFDVRRDSGDQSRVTLLQGHVRVVDQGSQGRAWVLAPGQALVVAARSPRPAAPGPADVQAATGWTGGVLTFRDATLADVVAEANRYSRAQLVLADDPAMAKLRVDGVFTAGDIDAMAASLSEIYDLKLAREPNGAIRLSPPPSRPRPPSLGA